MKKKFFTIIAAVIILAVGVGVGAYAASSFGTQSDPLVSKSYVDEVLTPKLHKQYQSELNKEFSNMELEIQNMSNDNGLTFVSVALSNGQTLSCNSGCEVILCSGSAKAVSSVGLPDTTDGTVLVGGDALIANHLYLTGTNSEGVKATSTVKLLVRGVYSIK